MSLGCGITPSDGAERDALPKQNSPTLRPSSVRRLPKHALFCPKTQRCQHAGGQRTKKLKNMLIRIAFALGPDRAQLGAALQTYNSRRGRSGGVEWPSCPQKGTAETANNKAPPHHPFTAGASQSRTAFRCRRGGAGRGQGRKS